MEEVETARLCTERFMPVSCWRPVSARPAVSLATWETPVMVPTSSWEVAEICLTAAAIWEVEALKSWTVVSWSLAVLEISLAVEMSWMLERLTWPMRPLRAGDHVARGLQELAGFIGAVHADFGGEVGRRRLAGRRRRRGRCVCSGG